jgi:hypothetical protein
MKEPITQLLQQGTIGGIFLAVLLVALVAFTVWARKLITEQMKQKDDRITLLEADVKELQLFNRKELMIIIADTQKMMQKSMDTFERIEDILRTINKH